VDPCSSFRFWLLEVVVDCSAASQGTNRKSVRRPRESVDRMIALVHIERATLSWDGPGTSIGLQWNIPGISSALGFLIYEFTSIQFYREMFPMLFKS
jgi:hypothetical protein